MNINSPAIGAQTGSVLSAVYQEAMDGYMLQKMTGLSDSDIGMALEYLKSNDLIEYSGNLNPDLVKSIYVWVPPSSKGQAALVLNNFKAQVAPR